MLEQMEQIVAVIVMGLTILVSTIGFIVTAIKNMRNKNIAETEIKKTELNEIMANKIVEMEKMFSQAATVLKKFNISIGAIKKENVMNYIEGKCIEKGIKYDEEYWSSQVEKYIEILNVNKE